jgi:glycosyltransferase involved in cell wall biosynthesis
MKALFIGPNLAAGGAERQWSILLPGLRRRGFDARLVALDGGGPFAEPLQSSGVPLEVLNMRSQADIARLARSRLLRRFMPDVVMTRGVSGLYVGQALAGFRRARHVYNEHLQVGMHLSRRREAMAYVISRKVDLVIAVSPGQAGPWLERGYPRERIVVVPNGVEASSSADPRTVIRQELGIGDSEVVALLVASLRPEKRVSDFVRAVVLAREHCPELTGVVVGDGIERRAVEAAAAGSAGVRLLGHRDDVPRMLAAADIFVLTSGREASPMSILEAMSAGLPVLATNVGGIPEIVAAGETGLLVEPADADALVAGLVTLAKDPKLRATMGQAAVRRHRERWDAEPMIDAYARILRAMPELGRR